MLTKEWCATQSTKLLKTDCELSSSRALELYDELATSPSLETRSLARYCTLSLSRPKKAETTRLFVNSLSTDAQLPTSGFFRANLAPSGVSRFVMCQQIVDLRFKFADYSTVQNQFTRCSLLKMANAMYVFAIFGLELTDKLDGPKNLWVF
jgi:hypothetical protein